MRDRKRKAKHASKRDKKKEIMVHLIDADKLRSEIERRIKESNVRQANLEKIGQVHADIVEAPLRASLKAILSFLDTLESEKPIEQDELEKEIETQVYGHFFDLHGIAITGATAYATVDDMAYIARYFAEWGAEHLKK